MKNILFTNVLLLLLLNACRKETKIESQNSTSTIVNSGDTTYSYKGIMTSIETDYYDYSSLSPDPPINDTIFNGKITFSKNGYVILNHLQNQDLHSDTFKYTFLDTLGGYRYLYGNSIDAYHINLWVIKDSIYYSNNTVLACGNVNINYSFAGAINR